MNMNNLRNRMSRFMIGRYGIDELAKVNLGAAVGLMVLNLFFRIRLLNPVILVLLGLVYFRMFSRNISARYGENQKYLQIKARALGLFGQERRKLEDRKENHIYKCPGCGQKLRIPRGRGKIVVTCPKCRTEFTRKS